MILFTTTETEHLVPYCRLPLGAAMVKRFPDGQILVQIGEDVADRNVCVLTAVRSPLEPMTELFMLLDELERHKARIYLFFTYFGYGRYDRLDPGERILAARFGTLLGTFAIRKIGVVHAQSARLHTMLKFENLVHIELFCHASQDVNTLVVAPHKGALALAESIAQHCRLEWASISREARDLSSIVIRFCSTSDIKGKHIMIVDDMVGSGETILNAATFLKEQGAREVTAFVTHGVFEPGARERIEQNSALTRLTVTNTLPQAPATGKIAVVDIMPFLETTLRALDAK